MQPGSEGYELLRAFFRRWSTSFTEDSRSALDDDVRNMRVMLNIYGEDNSLIIGAEHAPNREWFSKRYAKHFLNVVFCLSPVHADNTQILLIDAFPDTMSLQKQQYHYNSSFWSILEEILDVSLSIPYHRRLELLKEHGLGLWSRYSSKMQDSFGPKNDLSTIPHSHIIDVSDDFTKKLREVL